MTTNNKGRAPGKDATPKTTDSRNHTTGDPLVGWHNLAKPAVLIDILPRIKSTIVRLALCGVLSVAVAEDLIQRGGLRHV